MATLDADDPVDSSDSDGDDSDDDTAVPSLALSIFSQIYVCPSFVGVDGRAEQDQGGEGER